MTAKTYAYAVITTQGTYGSGDSVQAIALTDDLALARAKAKRATVAHRRSMAPYGGTSAGYRVVRWDSSDRSIQGYDLDRTPSI